MDIIRQLTFLSLRFHAELFGSIEKTGFLENGLQDTE
jgi:hypothetical protein